MAKALDALIQSLQLLPGVGVKSASRIAYHLLQHDRAAAGRLANALVHASEQVRHCTACYTFTEHDLCDTCADASRDASILCVVETPADQAALERTAIYRGRYFVLMGTINPLASKGLHDIGLDALIRRLDDAALQEVVLATSFTAEGEATAHIIQQLLKHTGLKVTRLSRGVPIGSELEYIDLGTIAHAFADRR